MAPQRSTALLSVAQAASVLGVHPNTIRAWTDAGRLTAYRINARGDRRFRRDDVNRLLVADAPAAEIPPSRSELQTRDPEMAIIERIATSLAATPSPESVARALVEALRTELHVERAAVYLVVNERQDLVAHAGFSTPPRATWDDAARSVVDGDQPLLLATRRAPVGMLLLDTAAVDALTPAFRHALLTMASTALASSRVIVHARRELRRARALRSVTKELTGELDLGALLGGVVEMTRTLFDADKAGLWILDDTEHPYRLAAHHNLGEAFLAQVGSLSTESETVDARAIRERRSNALRHADTDAAAGVMGQIYAAEGIRTACLVPLIGGEQALGLLGLYHRADRPWPVEEVALLEAFADQAAVALQNARLFRSVADQAARMKSIQDLSARLNRLTDVRAIGEAIVAEATTLAEYHDIRVYQVDWERGSCDPIAFTREMLDGDPENAEELLRVAVGEGFTGWVAEHGEPLLINDAIDDDRGKTIVGTEDVPESMLLVPMLYEGRAIGVIVLSQLGFNRFSPDDLQTMNIFAGYAAQAIANATTYGELVSKSTELSRRSESQRHLLETNARLLGSLDQADILETIADSLRDVVAYDNLSIYRTDATRRDMVPVLTRERHEEEVRRYRIPFGHGLMGWAVEHAEPILANDALSDARAIQIPGTPDDPEAVVVVPLIVDGEVLGALNVSRIGGAEVHFTASDFELIQLFAAQASIALRNADRHLAVSQRAETDALTGLGNHGAFQQDLTRQIESAAVIADARHRRVAVLMMDLDAFKGYNDRHGHPAGDALLYEVATTIYGAARSDDRVYRYGGDEFALILPGTSISEAEWVGERIRAAVAGLTAVGPSPVTITIGVAGTPDDATDRAGLIEAADVALFFGKRAGENRVVRSDHLPRDVVDLRATLDDLASAALRDGDDPRAVEHLMERATQLSSPNHEEPDAIRGAVLAVTRSLTSPTVGDGRGDRVGHLAGMVAERLALDPAERMEIELAARLNGLGDRALAEISGIPSLRGTATLVAGVRAVLAEGARRTRRAGRARGSAAAHSIAAAHVYDELVSGVSGRADAMAALRTHPATIRHDVLEALGSTVDAHPDAGRRRRSSDRGGEARGAA
ncbi:MAG: GAF domain-containing protein [Candidatus Limnocylindria bacterium]